MPRKRKVPTPKENVSRDNGREMKAVELNRQSPEELGVMKIIISSQKTDTNHKKGLAEMQKLYEKVRVLFVKCWVFIYSVLVDAP